MSALFKQRNWRKTELGKKGFGTKSKVQKDKYKEINYFFGPQKNTEKNDGPQLDHKLPITGPQKNTEKNDGPQLGDLVPNQRFKRTNIKKLIIFVKKIKKQRADHGPQGDHMGPQAQTYVDPKGLVGTTRRTTQKHRKKRRTTTGPQTDHNWTTKKHRKKRWTTTGA
jgi:hypothetical protein